MQSEVMVVLLVLQKLQQLPLSRRNSLLRSSGR